MAVRAAKAAVDYGFHMTVSWWGRAFADEMETLVRDHGVASFKFFLAYKGRLMLPDADLIAGFLRCRELGALAAGSRRERRADRPSAAEAPADGVTGAARPSAVAAAAMRGGGDAAAPSPWRRCSTCRSMSCTSRRRGAADAIEKARRRGVKVVGETLPGFLAIDDTVYRTENFDTAAGHVMSPPYRPREHQEALWRAVRGRHAQHHRHRSLLLHPRAEAPRPR